MAKNIHTTWWQPNWLSLGAGLAIGLLCLQSMAGQAAAQDMQDGNATNNSSNSAPVAPAPEGAGDPAPQTPQTLEQKLEAQFGMEFNPARGNFVPSFNERTALFFGKPKVGNPYAIEGQEFRPFFPNQDYVESGMASWYGDDFHGKDTANGGQFNMGLVSAAHRTLPLPAVAVIVNLRTGTAVKLVINDRGPFAKNRILDMSKQAANLIGYYGVGTAPVKVIFLRQETIALWQKMGRAPQ